MLVISRLEGWKCALPASSGFIFSRFSALGQCGQRVPRFFRVGHVPLHALHLEQAVERAAPADLDRIAGRCLRGAFAKHAGIGLLAPGGEPIHDLAGAVDAGPSSSAVMRKLIEPPNARPRRQELPRRPSAPPRCRLSYRRRPGHKVRRPRFRPRKADGAMPLRRRAARHRCDPRSRYAASPCRCGHRDCPRPACRARRREACGR